MAPPGAPLCIVRPVRGSDFPGPELICLFTKRPGAPHVTGRGARRRGSRYHRSPIVRVGAGCHPSARQSAHVPLSLYRPAAQVQSAADQRALAARRAARQVGSDEESMRTGDDPLHAARAWRRRGHLTPAKTRPSAPPLCLIRRKLAARVTKLQVASAAQVTQLAARVTLLSAVRVTQLAV